VYFVGQGSQRAQVDDREARLGEARDKKALKVHKNYKVQLGKITAINQDSKKMQAPTPRGRHTFRKMISRGVQQNAGHETT